MQPESELTLGDRLTNIPQGIATGPGIDRLIDWAETKGCTGDLIEALCEDRPRKPVFGTLRDEIVFVLPAANFEEALPPAH